MPDTHLLDRIPVDPQLENGARNAVQTCLSVTDDDRVVLIFDLQTLEIAAAIFAEIKKVGAEVCCFVLEERGGRPMERLPQEIQRALESSTVSLMIVQPLPGELKVRTAVLDLVRERGTRHAHMPGVDHRMMVTGMRGDFVRVAKLQDKLLERLRPESVVNLWSPVGTDLQVTFTEEHRWIRCDGLIEPGVPQNLPAGQLYTTPKEVEGIFVGDGAIGDWFSIKYPDLANYPLTVGIRKSRVIEARCDNAALARQFLLYLRSNSMGDRVGEFAIGTNLVLTEFLGMALQDENVPGAHLAFGGAAVLASTGARWTSQTHLPLIARELDIDIDGQPVMRGGVFVPSLLS